MKLHFKVTDLDSWYKELPGQWDRIWLMPGSIDNEFNYVIIKNGILAYMPIHVARQQSNCNNQ